MSAHCVPVSEGGPSVFCVLCEKRRSLGGRDEKKRRRRGETEWKEVVLRNFESCVKLKALVLWWECLVEAVVLRGKKEETGIWGSRRHLFFPQKQNKNFKTTLIGHWNLENSRFDFHQWNTWWTYAKLSFPQLYCLLMDFLFVCFKFERRLKCWRCCWSADFILLYYYYY